MEEAKADAKADPKGGGNSKLLIVVVLFNTVVAGGALASSLLRSHPAPAPAPAKSHEGEAEAAAPAEGEHGAAPEGEAASAPEGGAKADGAGRPVARIDNLVVRLRNPEADRFARITIDVELGRAADLGAFQSGLPRVRDATITAISDYTAEQLAGSTGMSKLKADLMKRINEVMPGGKVTAVYLSDFVVQ